MLRRKHRLSSRYRTEEADHDDLVLRIRRLAQHKAYDRAEIGSPLLRRLAPNRATYGQSFSEADLRRRLREAELDANAVSYLVMSAEAELDLARLRLTDLPLHTTRPISGLRP